MSTLVVTNLCLFNVECLLYVLKNCMQSFFFFKFVNVGFVLLLLCKFCYIVKFGFCICFNLLQMQTKRHSDIAHGPKLDVP